MSNSERNDFSLLKRSSDLKARRFVLNRTEDASGVSGIGVVAEGVEFGDGTCALRWLTKHRCTAIYDSILVLEHIHGHEGKTKVVWIDQ